MAITKQDVLDYHRKGRAGKIEVTPTKPLSTQRDLSLARTVEIRAISDYNKSLVDFEAVQQVPINGGGSFVQVAR